MLKFILSRPGAELILPKEMAKCNSMLEGSWENGTKGG